MCQLEPFVITPVKALSIRLCPVVAASLIEAGEKAGDEYKKNSRG